MRVDINIPMQKLKLDMATGEFAAMQMLGGQFLSETLKLPAGDYAARVQIVFSEAAAGETITIAARSLADGSILDRLELAAVAENLIATDELYLKFHLDAEQTVEIYGHASAHASTTLPRYLTVISTDKKVLDPEDFYFEPCGRLEIKQLSCVIFGTTAVCNASCIHCPTNKDYRRSFPHGYMSFELFARIIADLAAGDFRGWFLFGLFGEPLEDPLLEKRLHLIKERLPLSRISVATNCGVYDPQKHAFVIELVDTIGIHVEAVTPDVYNRLMHPLKADRVFPKIALLLGSDKSNKVHITTPVHKGNLAEISNIRRYFEAYGATEPHFTPIGNRSWEAGPWRDLSLAPTGGYCHPIRLQDFIVDWDGAVLACCLDFAKSAKLGDLSRQSINEVLNSEAWLEMQEIHRTKSWSKKTACSRCRQDHTGVVNDTVQAMLDCDYRLQRLAPRVFQLASGVTRDDNGGHIHVGEEAQDGIVIYGPYQRVMPGRYRVSHQIEVTKLGRGGGIIEIDTLVDAARRTSSKRYYVESCGPLKADLEFQSDGLVTEFRVGKMGVEFTHRGADVHQL